MGDSWEEQRALIVDTIKRIEKTICTLDAKLDVAITDVAVLKAKMIMYAGGIALAISIGSRFIK